MLRFILIALALISLLTVPARASRNGSGTYTISATGTYPYVPGTVISSTTMNSIFSDLTTEMTDSLSRTGKGYMLSPLLVPAGSASLPALSFSLEPVSGIWRAGTGDIRFSVAGAAAKSGWNTNGFRLIDPASGASAFGINLQAPALSASYTLVFPTALPAADAPLIVKTDGTTIISKITAAYVQPATITATEIANATITGTQIANSTILGVHIQDGSIQKADLNNTAVTSPSISVCTQNPADDGRPFGYWKDVNGTVHLQGYVGGCTTGGLSCIAILPTGYYLYGKVLAGAATSMANPSVAASWYVDGRLPVPGTLCVITATGQNVVVLDGISYTP